MIVDSITIRRAIPTDRAGVLTLLSETLSWVPDDLFDQFFTWKHEQGPFGPSPAWVATDGDKIVGYRTFLRWEFEHPDGRVRRAVRAVDTATHPNYQGRQIFSRLTLHALAELRDEGVDFVFNTPNGRSRPGYLKMGWVDVGRLPAMVRPSGAQGLVRMARSRLPADRWSVSALAGESATNALADPRTAVLLAALPAPRGLRTVRTQKYLTWRYGFDALRYRAVMLDDDPAQGLAVIRIRRRGSATEAAVCELLTPLQSPDAERALARSITRSFDADYAIRIDASAAMRLGYVRIPRQGPMLTYRHLNGTRLIASLKEWQLQLGDIELM